MNRVLRRVMDRESSFYGYAIYETDVPELPEVELFVDTEAKVFYINKGARPGANVVSMRTGYSDMRELY